MGLKDSIQAESSLFETKSKVGINEVYGNCEDSYRPVFKGFVQYQ